MKRFQTQNVKVRVERLKAPPLTPLIRAAALLPPLLTFCRSSSYLWLDWDFSCLQQWTLLERFWSLFCWGWQVMHVHMKVCMHSGKWSADAVSDVTYFGRYNVSLSDVGAVFPGVSWPCVELGVGLHHLSAALQLSVCNDDHLQWRTRSYHLPLPAASLPTVHSSSGWLCQVRFRSLLNKPKSFNKTHKMQIFLDTPESFPLMMDAPS